MPWRATAASTGTPTGRYGGRDSTRAVWRSDPSCRRGGLVPPTPIGDGSTDTGPATPQGLAALLATGIAGTGAGEELAGGSGVAGTLFLDGGDGEAVTARVTADPSAGTCPDGVECEERDGALVTWALDVPRSTPCGCR